MFLSPTLLPAENPISNAHDEREAVETRSHRLRVSRTVILLGMTSLLTDLSAEMVSAILPLYLTVELKFTPLQFGAFDGLSQAVTAPVRIVGGVLTDRYRRYQEIASVGYGLSAVCKLGLLVAGSAWSLIMTFLFLDRVAKGIRTAPRDALLALSCAQQTRAEAFGVHRTFDTIGAMLGPFVAFSLLGLIPNGFDAVFVVSFCFAAVGTGIVTLLVKYQRSPYDQLPLNTRVSWRSIRELFQSPSFRALLAVCALLSCVTASDAFIYLALRHRADVSGQFFPLLYLGTALATLMLAMPVGRLADQFGRGCVFWVGYVLLGGVYGVLLLPTLGPIMVACCLALLGAYYAATDGVLMAMAGSFIPQPFLTSGLACLATVAVLMRFLSSVMFGSLWSWRGPEWAVGVFGIGLLIFLSLSLYIFTKSPELARG
jgi:MFS family permease